MDREFETTMRLKRVRVSLRSRTVSALEIVDLMTDEEVEMYMARPMMALLDDGRIE